MRKLTICALAMAYMTFIAVAEGAKKTGGAGGGGGGGGSYVCQGINFWKESGAEIYHFTGKYVGADAKNVNSANFVISAVGSVAISCEKLFGFDFCASSCWVEKNVSAGGKNVEAEIHCKTGDVSKYTLDPDPANAGYVYMEVYFYTKPPSLDVAGSKYVCSYPLHFKKAQSADASASFTPVNTDHPAYVEKNTSVGVLLLRNPGTGTLRIVTTLPGGYATDVGAEYRTTTDPSWKPITSDKEKICGKFLSLASCSIPALPITPPAKLDSLRLLATDQSKSAKPLVEISVEQPIDDDTLWAALNMPYVGTYNLKNVQFRSTGCGTSGKPSTNSPLWLNKSLKITSVPRSMPIKGPQLMGQLKIFEDGSYFLAYVVPGEKTVEQAGTVVIKGSSALFYIGSGELQKGFLAGHNYSLSQQAPNLKLLLDDSNAQSLGCTQSGIESVELERLDAK